MAWSARAEGRHERLALDVPARWRLPAHHTRRGGCSAEATVPVLEAVDSFLFGIVLVIFAYGIAIGFVFALPKEYGERLQPG